MKNDKYISLIYKSLNGALSDEDAAKLREWQHASPENSDLVSSITEAWKTSELHDLPYNPDVKGDFNKMMRRLDTDRNKSAQIVPINRNRKWRNIAAIIAIVSVCSWLVWNNLNPKTEWQTLNTIIEIQEFTLPDGSTVWLNEHSELHYPSTFDNQRREVKLSGEAFFEVIPNESTPFQVLTESAKVIVLGTSFNLQASKDDVEMKVSVLIGKVRLQSQQSDEFIDLNHNESGTFNRESNKLEKITTPNLNAVAWQKRRLIFQDTPLDEVINTFNQFYKVSIDLRDSTIQNCPFTGRYPTDQSILEILEEIADIFKMNFQTITDNEFQLTGGICK